MPSTSPLPPPSPRSSGSRPSRTNFSIAAYSASRPAALTAASKPSPLPAIPRRERTIGRRLGSDILRDPEPGGAASSSASTASRYANGSTSHQLGGGDGEDGGEGALGSIRGADGGLQVRSRRSGRIISRP